MPSTKGDWNFLWSSSLVTDSPNDDALAKKIRLIKNFGFAGLDTVIHLGTNGKMPEICAAMGLASFETIDDILAANQTNYETYRACLDGVPGVHMMSYDELEATNWQYIILEVDDAKAALNRDELMTALREENVLARRYFYPGCHRMEPYRTLFPRTLNRLPVTDELCQRVLCLPTGTSLSPADVETVCEIIRSAVEAALRARRERATA